MLKGAKSHKIAFCLHLIEFFEVIGEQLEGKRLVLLTLTIKSPSNDKLAQKVEKEVFM